MQMNDGCVVLAYIYLFVSFQSAVRMLTSPFQQTTCDKSDFLL